ncbi:MAG TPA: HlyD family efflux transporter periplasmic adaptor subunit [Candidatus Acidoferrum sp.]|nr:HlyD family efflux transporter periplasmic adaptor subunit [Candidatus Acidoferrum sp.]
MPSRFRRGRRVAGVLVLAIGAIALADLALRPAPAPPLVGMVRATEIKIAPEVSGRIAALPVKAGEHITAGTVIAVLSSPELSAAVEEARAAVGQARASREHVYAGVRQEQVDIAAREVDKATADLTFAEEQFRRTSSVASAGYSSKQNLDSAQAALDAARANLAQTQSEFAAAQRGPTAEDRASADAEVTAAEASLAVLERRAEKLQLRAPVDGVVETVVGELGEATVPGRTVLTITATAEPWFSFNIREDALRGIDIGTTLTLTASGNTQPIAAKVTELRRLGDFATWRAARAVGDHDLNTFAVRADPGGPVGGLEPGMTVWISRGEGS